MATLLFNCERIDHLKRITSSDDAGVCRKKFKFSLEHESDSSCGEVESIYSYQDHPTASAHDTTDTEDDEYEVQSLSEVTLTEDTSSGPENCALLENLNSILTGNSIVDELYLADLSSSTSDDDETLKSSQKRCGKCKTECEEPFTLCLRCFKQRRTYLPPRPKGRRRKNKSSRFGQGSQGSVSGSQGSFSGSQGSFSGSQGGFPGSQGSFSGSQGSFSGSQGSFSGSQGSSTGSQGSSAGSQGSVSGSQRRDDVFNCHQTSQQGSSPEPRLNLCKCCFAGPVDGAFIHRDSVHTLFCYKCSVKQWRLRGRCPFCNQKLCKVAKIFPVED